MVNKEQEAAANKRRVLAEILVNATGMRTYADGRSSSVSMRQTALKER